MDDGSPLLGQEILNPLSGHERVLDVGANFSNDRWQQNI